MGRLRRGTTHDRVSETGHTARVFVFRLRVARFRGIEELVLHPGAVTVLLGPSNSGKSTVLAALDMLLHRGGGRGRVLSELDFYQRSPAAGFEIEAVIGRLAPDLRADVVDHLEGWQAEDSKLVPEPGGSGVEDVLRVRVRADADLELVHTFAKDESDDARFSARLRGRMGWVFDGRTGDPAREFGFYQGSVLDRLFDGTDLDEPVGHLSAAISAGADQVSDNNAVAPVLAGLGDDLVSLGLLGNHQRPRFEAGAVSRRELLQALRLALPAEDELHIPVERQGRGAQRLLLVSALLRLAAVEHKSLIAAFDEPEQALEPLRQTQMIERLRQVSAAGGQLFLATHASEMVRGFTLDELVVLPDLTTAPVPLAKAPDNAKRHYERSLDGAVVRGLFAPVPLLVEGPSDRPVLQTFWHAMVEAGEVAPMTHLGVDVVSCEGVTLQPPMTALLHHAGKPVVVWAEQDVDAKKLTTLRESPWSVYLRHDPTPGHQNLEESLAHGASVPALVAALRSLAADRDDEWLTQRNDLLGRSNLEGTVHEQAKAASDLEGFFAALEEPDARTLIAAALSAKDNKTGAPPFAMKGARQGRLVAEAICDTAGVPPAYRSAITELAAWIAGPRDERITIEMTAPAAEDIDTNPPSEDPGPRPGPTPRAASEALP